MHKNYFKISLSQEAGASGKSIEKEPQNSRPKLKKVSLVNILSAHHPMQVVGFCKLVSIL